MSDDDLLHGYQPAGPPQDLRASIVARSAEASAERSGFRDWLPALAAAALILLFVSLGYRLQADIDARLTVPDDRQVAEQWIPADMEGLR